MISFAALAVLSMIDSASPDCGAIKYAARIKVTEALIKKSVPVMVNSETVNANPRGVCARVRFSISKDGHAEHAEIVEDTRIRQFDLAVLEAMKRYVFCVPKDHNRHDFMLIFRPRIDVDKGSWKGRE